MALKTERIIQIHFDHYSKFTQLLMVLMLVPSLALGNNKLPREAKRHPLFCFLFFSSLHLYYLPKNSCLAKPCTPLDQFNRNAHLSSSQIVVQSQWYRSQCCHHKWNNLCPHPSFFLFSQDVGNFNVFFSLTPVPPGIAQTV